MNRRTFIGAVAGGLRDARTLCLVTLLAAFGQAAAQPPSSVTYGPPLHITQGGTYSGNWESQDPSVAAVPISTTEAVVIQDCIVRSKSDLIIADVSNACGRRINSVTQFACAVQACTHRW
jgi:hypothetical protein